MRPTRLHISLPAIVDNARRSQAAAKAEALCAVIKADAYGHGAVAVGRALRACGVRFLAVALVEEAMTLRAAAIDGPILVLGADYRGAEEAIVANNLTVAASQTRELDALAAAAARAGHVVDVHLELDCGMARLGSDVADLTAVAEHARTLAHVRITGVMGHLSHADVPGAKESVAQAALLAAASAAIAPHAPALRYVHLLSSGALVTLPQPQVAMARCGLSLYGLEPVPAAPLGLTPALTWLTRPITLRRLPRGRPVSYGARWHAPKDSTIATLPVGYADGYPRLLGARGAHVLVRGQRAPIVGNVCMDLCMADVSDIEGASLDDEVVLIGAQGEQSISAHELAKACDTIAYEIVSGIMPRVPRHYVATHAA